MKHTCHAEGCSMPVPPSRLMCRRHWSMVSFHLRDAVWKHYRVRQCDDKQPSEAWCRAADAAVAAVAEKEGRAVRRTFLGAFFPGAAAS